MSAVIGSLRVDLGWETTELARGALRSRGILASFAQEVSSRLTQVEGQIRRVGIGLTAGITAPLGLMATTSTRTSASFEAAMNRVEAALRGISPEQFERLSAAARQLGPDVGLSAIEAADGIADLARAGMGAESVLRGGLAATLRLSAANLGSVEDAAALTTDVMQQFVITTRDLPRTVDLITGALDVSKFAFEDYQQAIAQAGGVAGAAGVDFEGFNAALAATAPLFASGSDAGTSFKTFITSLRPQSKEAEELIARLGLSFYDTSGRIKSMADIAQELRDALAGLSDASRTEALRTIFGTDAMRTAIGLMQQGRQGILDLQEAISRTDAGEKLAIQMRGAEAAANRASAAFERAKIALGTAGLLTVFTALSNGMAGVANAFASLPQPVLSVILVVGALAASLGPLTLAVLGLARIALPLMLGRLGLVGTIFTALINPVGAAAVLFLRLAVALTGANSALSLFAGTLARFLGPIGLLITALTLLFAWYNRTAQANEGLRQAADVASSALANQQEQTTLLATATGEARRALIAKMQTDRAAALQALRTGMADLAAARAAIIRAQAMAQLNRERMRVAANDPRLMAGAGATIGRELNEQADADLRQASENLRNLTQAVDGYNRALASASAAPPVNLDFGGDDDEKARRGPSAAELARRREEIRLQQELDVATARGDLDAQRRAENEIALRQREQDYLDAGLSLDLARTAARQDMLELAQAEAILNERSIAIQEEEFDLELARIREDWTRIDQLERQAVLRERIRMWQERGLALADAERRATEDLIQLDAARLEMRERLNEEAERQRAVDLARLRGDSENELRRVERAADLERRAREIAERRRIPLEDARDEAMIELDAEDAARLQGQFRTTFRDGVRAALEGDFGSWFQRWWTDRLTRSLEDALNNVADLLFRLIQGGEKGGGDIFGKLGSIFGGGSLAPKSLSSLAAVSTGMKVPGLAGGGRIRVGGPPGVDSSVLSLNGSAIARVNRGEDIRVSNGNERVHVTVDASPLLIARIDEGDRRAVAEGAITGQAGAIQTLVKKRRRVMGRS